MQKTNRSSLLTDINESDGGDLTNTINISRIMTRAKQKEMNNQDLQVLVDSVTKGVQTKYRKSIIRRAVHPTLVCSTPFPSQATSIPKELTSFSISSFNSDHPKGDQEQLNEENNVNQCDEKTSKNISVSGNLSKEDQQSIQKIISTMKVIKAPAHNRSNSKNYEIGLCSHSKTKSALKEKTEDTIMDTKMGKYEHQGEIANVKSSNETATSDNSSVMQNETSKKLYRHNKETPAIPLNFESNAMTNVNPHYKKKNEKEHIEQIGAKSGKPNDYLCEYQLWKKKRKTKSDEQELSSEHSDQNDKLIQYHKKIKNKEEKQNYHQRSVGIKHRIKDKKYRPISKTRLNTSAVEYYYVTDNSEDDSESSYERGRRSKYAAAIPIKKNKIGIIHKSRSVPPNKRMKLMVIEDDAPHQKALRKGHYEGGISDYNKKSKKLKTLKHRSISRVRYPLRVSSSSSTSQEENSKTTSESEMLAQQYYDDERRLQYEQKLRKTNYRTPSKSRHTQHQQLFSPGRRYTHRYEDVGNFYERKKARLSRRESYDLENKHRENLANQKQEILKNSSQLGEVDLSDRKIVEILSKLLKNRVAGNDDLEPLNVQKSVMNENLCKKEKAQTDLVNQTLPDASLKELIEKSVNIGECNVVNVGTPSVISSLSNNKNINGLQRLRKLARSPYVFVDFPKSTERIEKQNKKYVSTKKLHDVIEHLSSLSSESSRKTTVQKTEDNNYKSVNSHKVEICQSNNFDEDINSAEGNVVILQNITLQKQHSNKNDAENNNSRYRKGIERHSQKKTSPENSMLKVELLPKLKSLPVENLTDDKKKMYSPTLESKPEILRKKKSPNISKNPSRSPKTKRYKLSSTKLIYEERDTEEHEKDSGISRSSRDEKKMTNYNSPQLYQQDVEVEEERTVGTTSRVDFSIQKENALEEAPCENDVRLAGSSESFQTIGLEQIGKNENESNDCELKNTSLSSEHNVHRDTSTGLQTLRSSNSIESCNIEISEENRTNIKKVLSHTTSDENHFLKPKAVPKKAKKNKNKSPAKPIAEKQSEFEKTEATQSGALKEITKKKTTTQKVPCEGIRKSTRERKMVVPIVYELCQLPFKRGEMKEKTETAKERDGSRKRKANKSKVKILSDSPTSSNDKTKNILTQPIQSNKRAQSLLSVESNSSGSTKNVIAQQDLNHVEDTEGMCSVPGEENIVSSVRNQKKKRKCELLSKSLEKNKKKNTKSKESTGETSETNTCSIDNDILSKITSGLNMNKTSLLPLTQKLGLISLSPNEMKSYVNGEFEQVCYRIEGTNSLKLGHLYTEESPSVFIIPKGVRAEIQNTGQDRVLFLIGLA